MISRAAASLIAVALGAACAHDPPAAAPPCTDPEPLRVVVQAGGHLNPDDGGNALATVVRVYQLKRDTKLVEASVDDVADKGKEVLGDDVVGQDEMMLQPGETQERTLARAPDTAFIAVVGLFRKPTGNGWRAIYRLPAFDTNHCHARPAAAGKKGAAVTFVLDESRVDAR